MRELRRIIKAMTLIVPAILLLLPPWDYHNTGGGGYGSVPIHRPLGRGLIFRPPAPAITDSRGSVSIAYDRLGFEVGAVIGIGVALLVAIPKRAAAAI